jgi:hypothetical protein
MKLPNWLFETPKDTWTGSTSPVNSDPPQPHADDTIVPDRPLGYANSMNWVVEELHRRLESNAKQIDNRL